MILREMRSIGYCCNCAVHNIAACAVHDTSKQGQDCSRIQPVAYARQGTLGRIDSATSVDTSVERLDDTGSTDSVIQPNLNRSINIGSAVNSAQSTLLCVQPEDVWQGKPES